jgi:hypothetical protein
MAEARAALADLNTLDRATLEAQKVFGGPQIETACFV